ncbi:MAG TPA: hypothetical protein VKU41_14025 [Polyangiaceae bacterium]|nr:hypothetical protein [Polyangiaceae bacterium]
MMPPFYRPRLAAGILMVLSLEAAFGCREDPTVKTANQSPIADARVVRDGQSVSAKMDGGAALLTFDFTGAPVPLTLDASHSYDPDGTITAYRWLSGTLAPDGGTVLPDGGVELRWLPPDAAPDWPGNTAQPQVELGQGIWYFTLWVTDNQGAVSNPDTIKITIGNVVDPVVQQCADAVVSTEPEACRQCLCKQSDMCRAAVVATACDATCWNLVNCIAANCPNFAMMQAMGDYSCVTANCSAYTGGASGATPVAPCFSACTSECAGGPTDGGSSEGGGMGVEGGD